MLANKCKHLVSAGTIPSDPTQFNFDFADDNTVAASNVSGGTPSACNPICAATLSPIATVLNAVMNGCDQAIANTGATSIFIMDGIDVVNKRIATTPLTINLPDGKKVKLSHVCDITIPGLPTILLGHIVPSLTAASLIGIRPLCKAGCTVVFDDKKCDVIFDDNVILRGFKDPSTDLWTLPIGKNVRTTPGPNILSRPGPCSGRAPHVDNPSASATPAVTVATFTHSVRTRANAIKFAHQSFAVPKSPLSSRLSDVGFSKGALICLNI